MHSQYYEVFNGHGPAKRFGTAAEAAEYAYAPGLAHTVIGGWVVIIMESGNRWSRYVAKKGEEQKEEFAARLLEAMHAAP